MRSGETGRSSGTPEGPGVAPVAAQVVLCHPSVARRRALRRALDADLALSVVGEARTAREAVALVTRLDPALLVVDLDLPDAEGLHLLEHLMAVRPLPVLGCSSRADLVGSELGRTALAAGAVDVVALPAGDELDPVAAAELRRHARTASRVRVITHPRGRLRGAGSVEPGERTAAEPAPPEMRRSQESAPVGLVVIGTSTGGPPALAQLLGELPADLGAAVVVVQHMAEGFVQGLAEWLDGLCALPVRVAADGDRLLAGTVHLAPSGANLLVVEGPRVRCVPAEPGQFHVPGVDATMVSVAALRSVRAVGVVLTGMGRDGAVGLAAMRAAGHVTLGQDEATSVVYGMPAAALALGGVQEQLPLDAVAGRIRSLCAPPRPVTGAAS